MFQFHSLHCRRCGGIRALRFAFLVEGLPSLGIAAKCAECAQLAFTMIRGRFAYCSSCETLTQIRVAASSQPGKVFAGCGACDQLLAILHAEKVPAAPGDAGLGGAVKRRA